MQLAEEVAQKLLGTPKSTQGAYSSEGRCVMLPSLLLLAATEGNKFQVLWIHLPQTAHFASNEEDANGSMSQRTSRDHEPQPGLFLTTTINSVKGPHCTFPVLVEMFISVSLQYAKPPLKWPFWADRVTSYLQTSKPVQMM